MPRKPLYKKLNINKLDMRHFFSLVKERSDRFKKSLPQPILKEYPVNALARKLHPSVQYLIIKDVIKAGNGTITYKFIPDVSKGTEELAYFSSGQYLSFFIDINGLKVSRAYSLSSAPYESIGSNGFYEITIKSVNNGLVSNYIHENWKTGDSVTASAPDGNFDYVYLRDSQTVVGIAGGSGITPFLSYAKSIVNGDENFNLILLYGNQNKDSILFKKQFDELTQKTDKIKVIYVLSNESEENHESDYEYGFINSDLIKKYAPATGYSVFLCGPQAMYNFVDKELEKLNIEKKFIRHEMFGEIHGAKLQENYPGIIQSEVTIKVTVCDQEFTVKGNPDDTILQILEKNGIAVPNRCRSGECGWCHTLVKTGKYWIPEKIEFRRKADEKYGFIHPCCTFPLSDMEIDVPPSK